jgi:prevent-host-death family protein
MADSMGVREAKEHFSRLIEHVEAGEEVVITRRGVEVAALIPRRAKATRRLGVDRGRYVVPDDFDAPITLTAP